MAKDKLEDFIISNKESFNDKAPPGEVWQGISQKLPSQNRNSWWKIAAVVFFFTTAFLAYQNHFQEKLSSGSNELAELESYYFTQINYKKSLVNDLQQQQNVLAGIDQDMQKLDAMYMVLKEEWKKKPSKQVLEALTLNLLVRLDLLNKQLQELNKETIVERSS